MSDSLPYTPGDRIPHLLGVRSYLNNYFAMFILLTGSRIRAVLAWPAYLVFGII